MAQPNPKPPFAALKGQFARKNADDLQVMRHCIGLKHITVHGNDIASQLAKYTVLVCIDTEHWTGNSDEMTEVGIGIIYRQDALQVTQLGEYGDNLMRHIRMYFFRLIEHAHMKKNPDSHSRGAEGNRFGQERFVTFSQMRDILHGLFVQPIMGVDGLEGYNRPIIILGHAVRHDTTHLNGKDLAFDIGKLGTVIRIIDTQKIVRQTGTWVDAENEIGLKKLVKMLGFEHSDPHTAANDAGRTLMSAIQLAIPEAYKANCQRSMGKVAEDIECYSRQSFAPVGGFKLYCCRCGGYDHKDDKCWATGLKCDECFSRGLLYLYDTHVTAHCTVLCEEVAEERRRWYNAPGQVGKKPKDPFQSHLQRFAPNAPSQAPTIEPELSQRRRWYAPQTNPDLPVQPFVYRGRSYSNTMRDKKESSAYNSPRITGSGYILTPPQTASLAQSSGAFINRRRNTAGQSLVGGLARDAKQEPQTRDCGYEPKHRDRRSRWKRFDSWKS